MKQYKRTSNEQTNHPTIKVEWHSPSETMHHQRQFLRLIKASISDAVEKKENGAQCPKEQRPILL
ncbi:hypothetical protein [Hoylesella shahii]|uniref:hypothetical protein n=1 Tax=Hoylesella shahii TaxID=228603 RepID=UPI001E54E40F|nr:hypothetical protein [Hoylesella shahii]